MLQSNLFDDELPVYRKFLPIINIIENQNVKISEWDIPYTIPELSYLVHSHYRYYGKFPSVVAGEIIDRVSQPSKHHYVLDNFCGSGTSLVEAKLRNIPSYGIDISWLSVLASNVKVTHLDTKEVKANLAQLAQWFERYSEQFSAPSDARVEKWFDPTAARDLTAIRQFLQDMEHGEVRQFFLTAFLGIVRRVSRAFDGEVRPHINKDKKQRPVLPTMAKKITDMCKDHDEFMALTTPEIPSACVLGDNTALPDNFADGNCYLLISHPPYLNSFNYTPVYNLEFYWGQPFEADYSDNELKLYKSELKAHPANDDISDKYFDHLSRCYGEAYRIQDDGAHLAIVIGDCTRKGKVIPVLDRTISIVEKIGYQLKEVNYRTTHYGLGKYAYKHRADYHGDGAEKKDGILLFKK